MESSFTPLEPIKISGNLCAIKLEQLTPPGSHKGRLGRKIAEQLKMKGVKKALVSSSGNFAESLAYSTQNLSISLFCVTDVLSSPIMINKLKTYPHVEVVVIDQPDQTGSHLQARLDYIEELMKKDRELYFVDQYANPLLPLIYENTLAEEIWDQTKGDISSLFVPCGTGGTIKGLGNYFKKRKPEIKICGVDARGSNLFRKGIGKRKLPGYGNGKVTELIKSSYPLIDWVAHVDDTEAVSMCHAIKQDYDLWVGTSSGAALAAFYKVCQYYPDLLPDRGVPVLVLPDGGEHYTDTIFSEEWCEKNVFNENGKRLNYPLTYFQS